MHSRNEQDRNSLVPPTQTLYVEAADEVTEELAAEEESAAQGYVLLREIMSEYQGEIIQ